jgi:dihydropteroate synthase
MERTLVLGILNVTPDSFDDGGKFLDPKAAIAQARKLMAEGADIIDVGGESTRPGAARVTEEEELKRVIPVITEIVKDGAVVSIDTTRSEVARQSIAAGAIYVNDVSGGLADEKMAAVIAANPKVQYIVMHWRGESKDMQSKAVYQNVVKEVKDELDERVTELLKAGVQAEQIILDPGIGFGREALHSWEIL